MAEQHTSVQIAQFPSDLLVVEDNAADAALLQSVFRQLGLAHRLHIVGNGFDALAFVRREGAYSTAPRPALIWLGFNPPRLHGREVLRRLKSDPKLRTIP